MTELGPDTAATYRKLRTTLEQIRQLEEDAELYKAQLRGELGAGAFTVDNKPALAITPTRRFNADAATDRLPPEWLAAITRPTVDAKLAKATLPPTLYEACQQETGKPQVRLA